MCCLTHRLTEESLLNPRQSVCIITSPGGMESRWREECLEHSPPRSPHFNPRGSADVLMLAHLLCPPANDTQSYWRMKVVCLPVRCPRLLQGRPLPFARSLVAQFCHVNLEL